MSYFAHITNGVVDRVDSCGIEWVNAQPNASEWVETSLDGSIGKNYAGIGMLWDGVGFYAPQPFPSWTLNKDTYHWDAPVPMPNDGKVYDWDESTQQWLPNE